MRLVARLGLAFASALGLCAMTAGDVGCAVESSGTGSCTATPFISPTTVTLDHSSSTSTQQFTTGTRYAGPCAIPAFAIAYTWNVSDPSNASITSDGVASCRNASLSPIYVFTTVATYSGTPPVATYVSSGLPSAALTCK